MQYAKIILAGNVGADPIARIGGCHADENKSVTTVSLGVTPRKDGKTEWFELVFRGRSARAASKHIKKGDAIFVEGMPAFYHWKDEDLRDRKSLQVHVTFWRFTESKTSAQAKQAVQDAQPFPPDFANGIDLDH